MTTPASYTPVGGGYSFHVHRVGVSMVNPQGVSVYFQPGDATAGILAEIEALDEVSPNVDCPKRGTIADMYFGEYFQ